MFRKINQGKVENEEGVVIHITGLETLKYCEKDKCVNLEWNFDPKNKKTMIFVSDADYWSEPSNKKMNIAEKQRLINNIKEGVKLLGDQFKIL